MSDSKFGLKQQKYVRGAALFVCMVLAVALGGIVVNTRLVAADTTAKPGIPVSCPGGGSQIAVVPGPECDQNNPPGCPGSTRPKPVTGFDSSQCQYSNSPAVSPPATTIGKSTCVSPTFFGLPVWYKYLELDSNCSPKIKALSDVWLIVAAVIEILLRLAALIAIAFVLVGGVQFLISQGEPDRTAKARKTALNALIGLIISVAAATVISFIAGRFN